MAKLYGKGTVTEIVKGKKYRIALSAGKDPESGRVYGSRDKVPDNAYALDADGKPVKPRLTYSKASQEQRSAYEQWKTPVKYLKHQETFLGTKRQAQLRVEEIRRELEGGRRIDAHKVGFADWCNCYVETRAESGKYRPKTIAQDRSIAKHLVGGFATTLVIDITPAMVDALYSSMRERGIGDTTIKQAHKMLKRVMAYAVRDGLITVNPVDRVDAPRKPKPNRNALSAEEANRLAQVCTLGVPTANRTAVYLGLALGARLGEVLGLQWEHVETKGARPFVHICQQSTDRGELGPLKTDKDDNPVGRVVPIDATTVAVLNAWKMEQRRILNELGIEQGGNTPVITNQIGTFTNHSRFERWWRSFCVENGYGRMVAEDGREIVTLTIGDDISLYPSSEYIIQWKDAKGLPCDSEGRRFSRTHRKPKVKAGYHGLRYHELRHTHFSMRLAAGMDLPTAQALGGWSTPDVLLRVYAHPLAENIWASAGFMDALETKKQPA